MAWQVNNCCVIIKIFIGTTSLTLMGSSFLVEHEAQGRESILTQQRL